ncbi:polymorphic toxin-type HINT domain-containing protein [Terrisporobacter vanillatitrophus]|uniref:polymorphic toxin-type HINT domain-containing protein n=1 Tax=Terrisporobacter vanillatitrophus TaxID=3058402 RepID=UPI003366489F
MQIRCKSTYVLRSFEYASCKITKKGCFTAGTLISIQNGDVPIEDIKEGDLVWAQDPETGEIALKKVVQTFVKETDTILYIKVAGEVIEATEQHVFYVDNVGWIPASMIGEGDIVVLQSGDKSTVEKIDKVVHNELITVYNFEVEDFHTYFVSDANVLVHNTAPCAGNVTKRWKVGDPIDSKTHKGNNPKWGTVRSRFWKNEAHYNSSKYSEKNIIRMKKGKAPRKINKSTGKSESFQLHHKVYRVNGGSNSINNLEVMSASEHTAFHKKYGYK